ncbi:MAG: DinB family protein [Methylobacterium sp.]|nr:DinB family protein [Methylobacterium sp.]MCA3651357.1 DinB family protein [Methylobacterium sp.]MCA4924168.1 DinB family protein [Methylobacterium sp.]
MITPEFARMMARYNAWQNRSLVAAASGLDDANRLADRGAFFRSIAGTFNHLFWGDSIWMWRFGATEKPKGSIADSVGCFEAWADFVAARQALDQAILDWAEAVPAEWLNGEMRWHSNAAGREVSRKHGLLVAHFFNHQAHHRGQIHAMLTAAGAKPDDSDLFLLPDRA